MDSWLKSTFPMMPSGDAVVIAPMTSFNLSDIPSVFGNISPPPTHAALSALPIAGAGGWQKFFDAWKAQGLIS